MSRQFADLKSAISDLKLQGRVAICEEGITKTRKDESPKGAWKRELRPRNIPIGNQVPTAMNSIQTFCRQVRARSAEHRDAIQRLGPLAGQIVSILRQELDSLVRVIFLLAQRDRQYRKYLIDAAVNGRKWTVKGLRKGLTDREMVELANGLHGWVESVYRFGCGFIHLSNLHDYRNRDVLQELPDDERTAVFGHLRYYHGGPLKESPTFHDIAPFLPRVFEKVADNLECYLREVENDGDLDNHAA